MARIKYIDDKGEHNGTLTGAEYYIFSDERLLRNLNDEGAGITEFRTPTNFSWQNTDYEPFKRAVNNKYKTTCTKAWLV